MHEWTLLIFTLLTQTSVGLMLLAAIYGWLLKQQSGNEGLYQALRPVLLLASAASVIGLAVSFLHIGYPLNALNAIRNFGTSWMAREIVLTSAFIGASCLTTLIALRQQKICLWQIAVCAVIGIADLAAMGEIYRHTSVIAWLPFNTHFSFFGTMLIAGPIVVLLIVRSDSVAAQRLTVIATLCILVAIAMQLVALPAYISSVEQLARTAVVTFPLDSLTPFHQQSSLRIVRWLLSLAGAALLAYSVWRRREQTARMLLLSSAGLLLSAEIVGRYMFYSVHG